MSEIFEPEWAARKTYWEQIKPTKSGTIAFLLMFYLPAIIYDALMLCFVNNRFTLVFFATSVLFKLIIALAVYHLCYFILSTIFHFITRKLKSK